MTWIVVFAAYYLATEILLRSNVSGTVATAATAMRKSSTVFASKAIADHWKEKALPAYAGQIFGASFSLLVTLALVILPPFALVGFSVIFEGPFHAVLFAPSGLGVGLVAGIIAAVVHGRLKKA